MGFARFYGHFAAAIGTLILAVVFVALVTQSNINVGDLGTIGFPLLALFYAFVRMAGEGRRSAPPDEIADLRERIAFLEGALEGERGRAGEYDDA